MKRESVISLAASGLLLVAGHGSAQAAGYIGAAFGQSDVDVSGYDEASSWQLFGGVQLTPNFAVEAAYTDLGEFEVSGARNTYIEVSGVEVTAVGQLPLANRVSLFGEAGFFSWDLDATLFGTDAGSDDGTDLTYGVGLKVGLVEALNLQFEYQAYPDISDGDVDTLYAGITYGF
jgi:OOP family OmpA-OmpF porin